MERVLIVEDDDFTRMLLEQACSRLDFECVAVGSGLEARDAWRARPFDIAILDLDLGPGPTGIDLARVLREEHDDVRVIILTGYSDTRLYGNLPTAPPDVEVVTKQDVRSAEVLQDLLRGSQEVEDRQPGAILTDTQVELLRLVAHGYTNAEIGRRLWLSEPGVDKALARLGRRLGIDGSAAHNRRVLLAREYYRMTGGGNGRAT